MKRSISIIMLLILEALKAAGINIEISESDLDSILQGGFALFGLIAIVHAAVKARKARKKELATDTGAEETRVIKSV